MIEKIDKSKRFQKPDEGAAYPSRYDFPTDQTLDLDQRREPAYRVITLDLSVQPKDPRTGQQAAFYEWVISGRGFAFYFYDSTDPLRTPIGGLINVATQSQSNDQFPAKNGRGVRCDFTRLYLSWKNQLSLAVNPVFCDLVVFLFDATPFSSSV